VLGLTHCGRGLCCRRDCVDVRSLSMMVMLIIRFLPARFLET
jgi:hypothetical protein